MPIPELLTKEQKQEYDKEFAWQMNLLPSKPNEGDPRTRHEIFIENIIAKANASREKKLSDDELREQRQALDTILDERRRYREVREGIISPQEGFPHLGAAAAEQFFSDGKEAQHKKKSIEEINGLLYDDGNAARNP